MGLVIFILLVTAYVGLVIISSLDETTEKEFFGPIIIALALGVLILASFAFKLKDDVTNSSKAPEKHVGMTIDWEQGGQL